jgi:hypothetical protein
MSPETEQELFRRLRRIERRLGIVGSDIVGGSVAVLGGYLLGEEDTSWGAFFAIVALALLSGGMMWFAFREFLE